MQLHIRVCSAASTPPPSASSSCRQTSRATDRSAERQTDRSAERQTDQQSDRQSCRGLPPSPTCLVSIRRSLSAVLVRSASSGPCARSASPSSRWSSSCSRPGSAPQTPATRGRAQLRPAAPWDCLRFCSAATVYKICAWLQLTAGFCLALACLLFPDSWESPEMRALCGDSVGSFSPGSCSVHWAYILAILGVLDAAILATLAFVLANRQDALLPPDAKEVTTGLLMSA
ncbi:uncharacterized protein lhfpl4b isoform X5 [Larimichthys crocea]|uniref:uncharacterized protein lhfpl4b isoform X5 n=1 Tax=Larimichthys crocea TaxID=215358 RepID=UPI000F5D5F70|nr:uncharacterized protein LOC113744740 isoform X5 [Larimichthys crocea]